MVHKGRTVCSAASETVFDRPAAMAEPIDRLRPAHTFPTISGMRFPRKIDRPAQIRAMLFLAA